MQAYRWRKGIAPVILNIRTKWRWVVNFMPCCFTSRKTPIYPLNRRLGGPQSWSGCFWEEKFLLPWLRLEPQTIQPVAQSLYRLYSSSYILTMPPLKSSFLQRPLFFLFFTNFICLNECWITSSLKPLFCNSKHINARQCSI